MSETVEKGGCELWQMLLFPSFGVLFWAFSEKYLSKKKGGSRATYHTGTALFHVLFIPFSFLFLHVLAFLCYLCNHKGKQKA